MLVVVGSIKGSPGATSVALGMAARWPDGPAVLVEADSDGGDLAARFGVNPEPGLAGLVLQIRAAGPDRVDLRGFTQRLSLGADVVMAPPSDAAAAAVEQLAAVQVLQRAAQDRPLIVDAGRLSRRSPLVPVVQAAEHVVVVVSPHLADLTQVSSRLQRLRAVAGGQVWVWLSGGGAYDETEVRQDLQVQVLGAVGRDKLGSGILAGRYVAARGWWRFPMVAAAQDAAVRLAEPARLAGHAEARALAQQVDPAGVRPR